MISVKYKKNKETNRILSLFRNGQPQPDNFEGVKEGPIDTEFDIGVTIEGLQEFHDEACLTVLNNKYNEGIAWHDVACHFRSVIVCEDSDQLMSLVKSQEGEDVAAAVTKSDRQVELESIRLNEVQPIRDPRIPPPSAPQPHFHQQQRPGPPRPVRQRPQRRPNGGFLSNLRGRFPFLF